MTGCLTLINKIGSCSIPSYIFQVIHPMKGVIKALHRLFDMFLWGSSSDQSTILWAFQSKVCLPFDEGGLGVIDLHDVAIAYDFKLWWRFRIGSYLWNQFMQSKYSSHVSPLTTECLPYHSLVWQRLCTVWALADRHIFWSVGNGDLFFWHDIGCILDL